jgi:hypothetical protein
VEYLRGRLDGERYANREQRVRNSYGDRYDHYRSQPVVVYNDNFSSAFHWWLMAQSIQTQAEWAYHHRNSMDQARYNAMLSQNAELAARVRSLEAQNVSRNNHWSPNGWDYDAMLDDNYVSAVYNPQPSRPVSFKWVGTCFLWLLIIAAIGAAIWFVFIRDADRREYH